MSFLVLVTSTGPCPDKTLVSAALLRRLVGLGHRALGVKPVETGCQPDADHELVPIDGQLLARASDSESVPLSVVAPYRFSQRADPGVALADAGLVVTISDLCEQVLEARRFAQVLVIDGGAGALAPLASDGTDLDLAAALGAIVVLVAPRFAEARPGLQAAIDRGVSVGAVVVLGAGDVQADLRIDGVPTCVTPPLSGEREERVMALERLFEQHRLVESLTPRLSSAGP